jgi:hypothetical protein
VNTLLQFQNTVSSFMIGLLQFCNQHTQVTLRSLAIITEVLQLCNFFRISTLPRTQSNRLQNPSASHDLPWSILGSSEHELTGRNRARVVANPCFIPDPTERNSCATRTCHFASLRRGAGADKFCAQIEVKRRKHTSKNISNPRKLK